MQIVTRYITELVFDPNNARKHSQKNLDVIKGSLQKFGQQKPIVISDNNVVLAGNGTLAAAKALDWKTIDAVVTDLEGFNATAYALADNRSSELAEWDQPILDEQLLMLSEYEEIDLAMLGFDLPEIEPLEPDDEAPAKVGEVPEEILDKCWAEYAGEFADQFENGTNQKDGVFTGLTVGYGKIMFLHSLYAGKRYPRHLSLAFHPQQFNTPGDVGSLYDLLRKIEKKEIKTKRLRFGLHSDSASITKIYGGPLAMAGHRMPLDFPADLAKDLINEFGTGGCILDPCHGWGGRLVGFLLSTGQSYHGIDPSPYQHKGVSKIRDAYYPLSLGVNRSVVLTCDRFEAVDLTAGGYDFALTSPPYFDVEKYIDDAGEQSWVERASYQEWRDSFYRILIENTFFALNPGGHFALQVGSQTYPLIEDGKALALKAGFEVLEVRTTSMVHQDTEEEKAESTIILRKPEMI